MPLTLHFSLGFLEAKVQTKAKAKRGVVALQEISVDLCAGQRAIFLKLFEQL